MLYNECRPEIFDQILGNKQEVNVLKGIIRNKSYKIRKQYLFSSDSGGVGKTTSAIIFAKAINCNNTIDGNPCNKCDNCVNFNLKKYPDFMSINGAEYNQVDKVKPIIEVAKTVPIMGKDNYRVIVIDEAQRMSPQAMSEFLNPFEFSNDNTVFILTTTNKSSIPQPIISRMIEIELVSPPNSEVVSLLKKISPDLEYKKLQAFVDANYTDGSVRTILSKFEKMAISDNFNAVHTNVYNEISSLIFMSLVNGVHNYEDKIYKLGNSVINTIDKILIEFLSPSPILIDKVLHDKIKKSLPNNLIKQFTKDFLKYKISSLKELILMLYVYDDFSVNVNVENDIDTVMESYGFVRSDLK